MSCWLDTLTCTERPKGSIPFSSTMEGVFKLIREASVNWNVGVPTKKERQIVFRSSSEGVKHFKQIMKQFKQDGLQK